MKTLPVYFVVCFCGEIKTNHENFWNVFLSLYYSTLGSCHVFEVILKTVCRLGLLSSSSINAFVFFSPPNKKPLSFFSQCPWRRHWWMAELHWKPFTDWCNRAPSEPCRWVIKVNVSHWSHRGIWDKSGFSADKNKAFDFGTPPPCRNWWEPLLPFSDFHDHRVTIMVYRVIGSCSWSVFSSHFLCAFKVCNATLKIDGCHVSYFFD